MYINVLLKHHFKLPFHTPLFCPLPTSLFSPDFPFPFPFPASTYCFHFLLPYSTSTSRISPSCFHFHLPFAILDSHFNRLWIPPPIPSLFSASIPIFPLPPLSLVRGSDSGRAQEVLAEVHQSANGSGGEVLAWVVADAKVRMLMELVEVLVQKR